MKKIITTTLRLTCLGFSFLTPRFKKVWIFGSNMGFAGNAKVLYIKQSEKNDEIKPIWIGCKKDVEEIRQFGLVAYNRHSVAGMFWSLIGGVYIYNSYVSDINLYTFGRAIKINLWHGVGIKNCERKISNGPIAEIFKSKSIITKLRALSLFIKPDWFLSVSDQMTKLCSECFAIGEHQFIKNMYPRCDIFFCEEDKRAKFIDRYETSATKELIQTIKNKYTYLYMPTWRDSGFDFLAGIDFLELNDNLKLRDELMIVKLHPVTQRQCGDMANLSNIILIDRFIDLNAVMYYTDCIITDYSSVYYDYLLLPGKRLLLYVPDLEQYISTDRDLAFDYKESTIGEFAFTYKELLSAITDRKHDIYYYKQREELINRFWGASIGSNSNDLLYKIRGKLSL